MAEPTRPRWVDDRLFPYQSRFAEVDGAKVHYIDEGEGPVFLMLHGNPTWSFLYRHIVEGLKDRFRCIALDYPGFGLSVAPPGYGFTVAEHARTVEKLVTQFLDLQGITMMVQDWGGPIGLSVSVRHPDRYRALVIGNTWGWPAQQDSGFRRFSKLMGGPLGQFLILRADLFKNVFLKGGSKPKTLSPQEFAMYKGPHPTPESRRPIAVMPKEILAAGPLLHEVERGLPKLSHLPVLIVWGARDKAFKARHRIRWETSFPSHRSVILDQASHFIQEAAPEAILAAIRDWWPTAVGGEG